jgi:hypothetical protein
MMIEGSKSNLRDAIFMLSPYLCLYMLMQQFWAQSMILIFRMSLD